MKLFFEGSQEIIKFIIVARNFGSQTIVVKAKTRAFILEEHQWQESIERERFTKRNALVGRKEVTHQVR